MDKAIDILELLEAGKTVQIKPQGFSMYPMLVPERDSAILIKADRKRLKRGDVVLYRRNKSILVLHRIWRRSGDLVYLVGDNQEIIEGPLPLEQIRGILVAFIRKGRTISVRSPLYLFYSHMWLLLRPFRKQIRTIAVKIKNKICPSRMR